jgi:hypothetical protein
MLLIAENLVSTWVSADIDTKQKLQNLVFPEGIKYSKENDIVGTERVNALFLQIPLQKRVLEENKNGSSYPNCHQSNSAPRT